MKLQDAEKLICPFMSFQFGTNENGGCEVTCMTKNCMAWEFDNIPISKPDKFGRYETKQSEDSGYCKRLEK